MSWVGTSLLMLRPSSSAARHSRQEERRCDDGGRAEPDQGHQICAGVPPKGHAVWWVQPAGEGQGRLHDEEPARAQPPCDRSPDEALHAISSERQRRFGRRQGRLQSRHRPSHQRRSAPGPRPKKPRAVGGGLIPSPECSRPRSCRSSKPHPA